MVLEAIKTVRHVRNAAGTWHLVVRPVQTAAGITKQIMTATNVTAAKGLLQTIQTGARTVAIIRIRRAWKLS